MSTEFSPDESTFVVVTPDNRVFYDLGEMWRTFDEYVTKQEFGASFSHDTDKAFAAGQRFVLDSIERDILNAQNGAM